MVEILRDENSLSQFFSVILSGPVQNECFDKFPLISTYPLHSMFIYLPYPLRTKTGLHGKLLALIHGFFCICCTVRQKGWKICFALQFRNSDNEGSDFMAYYDNIKSCQIRKRATEIYYVS